MLQKQIRSISSSTNKIRLTLQPASAWMAILGFIVFSALCILGGAGGILNLAFPVAAFAVGVFLYFRYPIHYIGFSWWMWFITPLVRRLVDYRSGFNDPSPILLAPYLVILVAIFSLWQHLPKTYYQGGLPFILSFVGVLYGYLIGLIKSSPIPATIALLEWLIPLLFGFHLFVNWRNYPQYRQNIERVFVWGVITMGTYGIIQYLVAPEWDRFWLKNTGMISVGSPEPLGIRVWSTMHSPGVFGIVIAAGLLLLINQQGALRLPASMVGYLAFLLSLVRAAWVMWLIGLFAHISSLKSKHQIRLIIVFTMMAIMLVPLVSIESFSEIITSRISTFSSIQNDGSATGRLVAYSIFFNNPLLTLVGYGIGNVPGLLAWDSGVLIILFALGWLGSILYLGGILLIFFRLLQDSKVSLDPFFSIARAISFGSFLTLIFGSQHLGAPGVILWGFLGLGMAASKYYHHQYYHHQFKATLRK